MKYWGTKSNQELRIVFWKKSSRSLSCTLVWDGPGYCNGYASTNTAVFGPSPVDLPANGGAAVFTLSGSGTATLFFVYFSPVTVTVNAAPTPSAVPSLSEWKQLLLAFLTITLVGWHFHRERSY
jgi:hypothetical protein